MTDDTPIYHVALPVPMRRLFDYLGPVQSGGLLSRGTRVKVPFGRHHRIGLVMGQSTHTTIPKEKLKAIDSVCDNTPILPSTLCDVIEKTAQYYHHPIGEVAFTGLPQALRQGKAITPSPLEKSLSNAPYLTLNEEQQCALDAIVSALGSFTPFLLEGVTGSGKTEIYLQSALATVGANQQVLILVPEIALAPQTQERFIERFGQGVVCYHSRMTPKARLDAWLKVHQGAPIVIGTRSAVFLPFAHLGLVVIDEEHDASFKQQEGFRYSARDVAVLRAKMAHCPIVLGSATPSFESLFNAKQKKYHWLHLEKRATNTPLPPITLLDVRHKKLEAGLSRALIQRIESHLTQGGQVLLFINRRGFSPTYMCYECGWMAECQRCDARLTYHHHQAKLMCHHCLYQRGLYTQCPKCEGGELNPVGQGTERIESFLSERFPSYKLARIDSDATRKKGSLEQLLTMAQENECPLLIGTQMLAKGHHFEHLSLVAVIDADGGLFSVDFRSIEHMAQLIIQVAGRAGRVHQASEVVVQTFHPEHPLLHYILKQDYRQIFEHLLKERQQCQLPPFSHLALVRAHATHPNLPQALLSDLQHTLKNTSPDASLLGPVPAPMLKRQGAFRYQLLLQASERKPLHRLLAHTTHFLENAPLAKRVRWSIDVDPLSLF